MTRIDRLTHCLPACEGTRVQSCYTKQSLFVFADADADDVKRLLVTSVCVSADSSVRPPRLPLLASPRIDSSSLALLLFPPLLLFFFSRTSVAAAASAAACDRLLPVFVVVVVGSLLLTSRCCISLLERRCGVRDSENSRWSEKLTQRSPLPSREECATSLRDDFA